jgi:hypothetical protein
VLYLDHAKWASALPSARVAAMRKQKEKERKRKEEEESRNLHKFSTAHAAVREFFL